MLTEYTKVNLNGSLKGGLNISASGDHDEVFNMTHMACPYEAPTSHIPLSFAPSGTTRLLALRFDDNDLTTIGPGPSRMASSDVDVINTPSRSEGGAGNNSNITDDYAENWALSSYLSTTGGEKGSSIELSTYAKCLAREHRGIRVENLCGVVQGDQTLATAGQDDPTCGVAIFGDYDEQTSYLALGLDGGKVAICLSGEASKAQGSTLVTDEDWHMLAWVYNLNDNTFTAYADPAGI